VAAAETVASARLLWEEGSRAGALATLREALAAAEDSGDREATRALARELAGMELASNRAQAALELLMRLSGLFGGDADALALRGNAQQRLALHAEAADSYLAALRLRPTEGKWMLGAAISLAALGRKAEAQAWVDRARERGAITPPIAAYLQQLGMATRP
jgi:tetratricopeptide (TPR) repeat protein